MGEDIDGVGHRSVAAADQHLAGACFHGAFERPAAVVVVRADVQLGDVQTVRREPLLQPLQLGFGPPRAAIDDDDDIARPGQIRSSIGALFPFMGKSKGAARRAAVRYRPCDIGK
jgi:hypothetical protein